MPTSPLRTILYLSTASVQFSPEMLEELLTFSRARNSDQSITGLLLYRDGCFMQLIQGPEEPMLALYHSICRDPRHEDITTLQDEPCHKMDFPEWSMGFRDLGSPEVRNLPGFSQFLDTGLTPQEMSGDVSTARRLLMAFKEEA